VLSLLYKSTLLYPNVNLSPSYSPCQLKHCFNHKKKITKCTSKHVLSLLYKSTLLYPNVNLSPSYSPCQLKHCFNHKKSQNVRLNMCLASCTSLHYCIQMLTSPLHTRHVSSNTAVITKCTSKHVLSLLYKPISLYPAVNLSPSYSPCQLKHCFNHKMYV
jgi:hypothetical protein